MHDNTVTSAGNHSHKLAANIRNSYDLITDNTHIAIGANGAGSSGSSNYVLAGTNVDTTLGVSESTAAHTHTVTISDAGGNTAHNNIPPYLAVYIFRRTT